MFPLGSTETVFVVEYTAVQRRQFRAANIEEAGKLARSMAARDKVRLLSVKTADQWAADQLAEQHGTTHGPPAA
jgi:hypothetical protein